MLFTIVHKYTIILYASICGVDAVEGSSETGVNAEEGAMSEGGLFDA